MTRTYTRHPAYYGYIYPIALRSRETRIIPQYRLRGTDRDRLSERGPVGAAVDMTAAENDIA